MWKRILCIVIVLFSPVGVLAQTPVTSYPAGWSPIGATVTLAVTGVTASVQLGWASVKPLPVSTPASAIVCNTGTVNASVAFGNSSVTATTANYVVLAGACPLMALNGAQYIAAISNPSGTTSLTISTGNGSASNSSSPGGGAAPGNCGGIPCMADTAGNAVLPAARQNIVGLPYVSIMDKQFGAKCDGSTDDSTAIQTALNYGGTNSAGVEFPNATCVIANAVVANSGSVSIRFHNTILVQTHSGSGITLNQPAINSPVVIEGKVFAIPVVSSAAANFLTVTYPSGVTSWAQQTLNVDQINCYSNGSGTTAPYSNSYTNCLTLQHVWNGVVGGINYTAARQASGLPVIGTSGVKITGDGYAGVANTLYNVYAFGADAGVTLAGYTEGTSIINPQLVDVNWGVRVGGASIAANNSYVGSSGITAINGFNVNLLQVVGGEINVYRTGVMCDLCQGLYVSPETDFYNAAYDGTNPYRAVVVNDSRNSIIGGALNGSSQGQTGEAGVLIVQNNSTSYANRIAALTNGVLAGVSLGAGTANNDVDLTVGISVTVPVVDSGSGNIVKYTNGGAVTNSTSNGNQVPYQFLLPALSNNSNMNLAVGRSASTYLSALLSFTPQSTVTGSTAGLGLYGVNGSIISVDGLQHIRSSGFTGTVSGCGTGSPTVVGSDSAAEITTGLAATGCTYTFGAAYVSAPVCTVTSITGGINFSYTISSTAITMTEISTSANKIDIICVAQSGG